MGAKGAQKIKERMANFARSSQYNSKAWSEVNHDIMCMGWMLRSLTTCTTRNFSTEI
jgi:hypothetical protein